MVPANRKTPRASITIYVPTAAKPVMRMPYASLKKRGDRSPLTAGEGLLPPPISDQMRFELIAIHDIRRPHVALVGMADLAGSQRVVLVFAGREGGAKSGVNRGVLHVVSRQGGGGFGMG